MVVFAFSSAKGGVGKSTLCILCARYLSALKKKVLCIDSDIQNSLTFYFLNKHKEKIHVQSKNLFRTIDQHNVLDNIISINDYLAIIPSHIDLRNISEISTSLIKNLLVEIKDFDYCLIDCSPYLNQMSLSILHASDMIISPLFLGQFEWKSSLMFQKDVGFYLGMSHKIHFVLNRCSFIERKMDNKITQQYLELLKKSFRNKLIETPFPEIRNLSRIFDTGTIISKNQKFARLFSATQNFIQVIAQINEVPKDF